MQNEALASLTRARVLNPAADAKRAWSCASTIVVTGVRAPARHHDKLESLPVIKMQAKVARGLYRSVYIR